MRHGPDEEGACEHRHAAAAGEQEEEIVGRGREEGVRDGREQEGRESKAGKDETGRGRSRLVRKGLAGDRASC